MNIQEIYYNLEPIERLNMFKDLYSLIENDKEIVEDEESLDAYTELTISLQSAITQINTIKENSVKTLEENIFLRKQIEIALKRDEGFNSEVEDLKNSYEEQLQNMRDQFRTEKAKLVREQINQPLTNKFVEEKLIISNEVNNFVKLKVEEFRNYLNELPKLELIKVYEGLVGSQDLKVRVLSQNILDFIKSGAKKITQPIEKKIMLEIEKSLAEESREVLDDDYR